MSNKSSFSLTLLAKSPIFEMVFNLYLKKLKVEEIKLTLTKEVSEIILLELNSSSYDQGPEEIARLSADQSKFVIVLSSLSETHGYFQERDYIETFKKKNVKKFLLPILGVEELTKLITNAINNSD